MLAVVAHPDDESFGLGAVIDRLAGGGTAVHILCYTHGEASTFNETGADLHRARESELHQAGAELGAASVTLLDYPDGRLAGIPPGELAAHAVAAAARARAGGLLAFDDTRGPRGCAALRQGNCEYLRWLVPPVAATPG